MATPVLEFRWAEKVPQEEISKPFIQGMLDRMVMGFLRYGRNKKSSEVFDHVGSLKKRLERYEETGNTEWLMDVANFAMIEFINPSHPDAHYRATDDSESPGAARKGKTRADGSPIFSRKHESEID